MNRKRCAGRHQPLVVAQPDDVWSKTAESTNSDQSMKWKIKRKSNDELRQNFVDMIAEQIKVLGMKLPGKPEMEREESTTILARSTGMSSGQWLKAMVPATNNGWKHGKRRTTKAHRCGSRRLRQ